ncbi:MAG: hypothetical protein O3A59_15295, partial [Nitrospirae bacterium]|nr:hypothetical protein [Nitrospirota bacterium]
MDYFHTLLEAEEESQKEMALGDRHEVLADHQRQSLVDQLLTYFRKVMSGKSELGRTPVVIFVDDAQWASGDPGLLDFLDRLTRESLANQWPLLLILTYWEKEWLSDVKAELPAAANIIKDRLIAKYPEWQPHLITKVPDLAPMLRGAMPGLIPEQISVLLEKADGNPRLLDEIILFFLRHPRWFEGRNTNAPLTEEGLAQCPKGKFELHKLVEDRFKSGSEEMQQAVALSSLQGTRFMPALTETVAEKLKMMRSRPGLEQAEDEHRIVRGVREPAAEFVQRVFHDVAQEALPDMVDPQEAQKVVREEIRNRLEDLQAWKNLEPQEQEQTLIIAASLLADPEENVEGRALAAKALVGLASLAISRWDFPVAWAYAKRWVAAEREGLWDAEVLTIPEVDILRNVAWSMGQLAEAEIWAKDLFKRTQQLATTLETPEAQRDLSISFDRVGDVAKVRGNYEEAEDFYRQGLAIRRTL